MKRIFYISIDNLSASYVGSFGGKMETKFVDILSRDSFLLKKHFCSSDLPSENFFSLMTGVVNYDLNEDFDLPSLAWRRFAGHCLSPQKELKAFKKEYVEEDIIDCIASPMDLASNSAADIMDEECGFVYLRYGLIDKQPTHAAYPEQIFNMDKAIGKVLAAIEEYADYDMSYIVLTGSNSANTVPCILKLPTTLNTRFYNANRNVNFVTRDIDIVPTVFDLEDQSPLIPSSIDGVSIANVLAGEDAKISVLRRDKRVFNHHGMQVV